MKAPDREDDLRERVLSYLRAHHTMTIATVGAAAAGGRRVTGAARPAPSGTLPMRRASSTLWTTICGWSFLSKRTSLHGLHIGEQAPVAVTVTEDYADWAMIQGVQLWGTARLLEGSAKAGAFLLYVRRFPFVRDLAADPRRAELMRDVGVYRVEPMRAAFTDNRTGVFGREVLQLEV